MSEIILRRLEDDGCCTIGRLITPSTELFTLERPWLGNERRVSCIPTGRYKLWNRYYNRGGYEAVEITDVPDRSYILIHVGNYVKNSLGCVLLGRSITRMNEELAVTHSRAAFKQFYKEFQELLQQGEVNLKVEYYGN